MGDDSILMPLMDLSPGDMWILVVLAILTIAYAILRPVIRKKDPLAKPPSFASLSRQRSVEREMQNVLVEIHEMTRQVSAQLDTRAAKLTALIQDADQRIATLKSLAHPPAAETKPSEQPPMVEADFTEDPPNRRYAEIYALADSGKSANQIAQDLNRPAGEVELILALRR